MVHFCLLKDFFQFRSMNLDFGTLPHDRELIGADGRSGGRRGPREGGRRDDR